MATGLSIALLAACGSGPETTPSSGNTVPKVGQGSPTPEVDRNALTIEQYIDLVAQDNVQAIRKGAQRVADNSPAAVYLTHRANILEARLDGGAGAFGPSSFQEADNGYRVCTDGDCIEYSEFTANSRHQLVEFSVAGKPVASRLAIGDGDPVRAQGGVRVTYLTSYKSVQSDAVFVTARVRTNQTPISANIYTAIYRSPDGKQRTAADASGPYELGANSNAIIYMAFPGVKFGGTVTLDGCLDQCVEQFKVSIRTANQPTKSKA
jgi:hypothetical protein